jgi:uncharacterized protein YbbK (DUF523 family)
MSKLPVGVSQCLLGDRVRYDGGHKHFQYLTEVLGNYVEFFPVCPEVAIGLGTPRKPIQLLATEYGNRVVDTSHRNRDITDALAEQADIAVAAKPDLCGYIFMERSPSCGVFDVKRHDVDGNLLDRKGRGAYAASLMALLPLLPVEEAERLNDPVRRKNFIARMFAYHDWLCTIEQELTVERLMGFYARNHHRLTGHSHVSGNAMRNLLTDVEHNDIQVVAAEFIRLFMETLRKPAGSPDTADVE